MIASLRGIVQHMGTGELVLEVGGVGLRLAVPASVLEAAPAIGQPLFLHTRLIVREEALSLYGFGSTEERELFDLLMQVNGIGPRLALAALSHLSPDGIRAAVAQDLPEVLSKVPGIGRKTAEKIIFHLKDRLAAPSGPGVEGLEADSDVLGVLTTLGYNLVEAQAAVQAIPAGSPPDVESRVRLALQYFTRG